MVATQPEREAMAQDLVKVSARISDTKYCLSVYGKLFNKMCWVEGDNNHGLWVFFLGRQ